MYPGMNMTQPAAADSSHVNAPVRRAPLSPGQWTRQQALNQEPRQSPSAKLPTDVCDDSPDLEGARRPAHEAQGEGVPTPSAPPLRPNKSMSNLRGGRESPAPTRAVPPVPPLVLSKSKPHPQSPPLSSPDSAPPPWGAQATQRGPARQEASLEARTLAALGATRALDKRIRDVELAYSTLEAGTLQQLIHKVTHLEVSRLGQVEARLSQLEQDSDLSWMQTRLHTLERGHVAAPVRLPDTHRWVQTQTGPYAIHRDALADLKPYLSVSEAPIDDDGEEPLLLVDMPKVLLSALVYWRNGMSLSTDVLPLTDLWLLREYAARGPLRDLAVAVRTELDRLAEKAMTRCLDIYGAKGLAASWVKVAVREAQAPMNGQEYKRAQEREFSVYMTLAEPPHGIPQKTSLRDLEASGRGGSWTTELSHACDAYNEWLKVYQLRLLDDRPIEIASAPKRIAVVKLHCTY
jgi:hypothetical protein